MLRSPICFLYLLASTAYSQEFRLSAGATDFQVFQRNERNTADIKLGGTADKLEGKQIEARLSRDGKPLKSFAAIPITTITGSTWTGELKGVPPGGPYTLELRAKGATPVVVHDLLVGDLWILAGQSNMEGVGDLVDVQQPESLVHSFDQLDQWLVAKEPLHELPGATDRVHWRLNAKKEPERLTGSDLVKFREERKKGAGLGLPFAVEMMRRTGIPVGLVPCAHGGTSMAQWDPALRDKDGDSLYGSTYRRFQAVGGRVKGILWYQGESDASPNPVQVFQTKFDELVRSFRKDFREPDLPFYYVQLGRFINNSNIREWNRIQELQRLAETSIPHSGVVAAVDFALDDIIHVGTPGLERLGTRLANLAIRDLYPEAKMQVERGPRLVSASFAPARGNTGIVRVKYSGVNKGLQSEGRIGGFSIRNAGGEEYPLIYKTTVDPADSSSVLLHVTGKLPAGALLYYGYGKDPYCNLKDAADMAALVFGPLEIGQ